jgi:hypothetical protein
MRTNDPNILNHFIHKQMGGNKAQSVQHQGVYVAYVTDTAATNPTLPVGSLNFRVPSLGGNAGWPSASYEGREAPPVGTECVIAFEGVFGDKPRVIAFNNWQPSPIMFYSSSAPNTTGDNVQPGDLWIDTSS